MQDILQQSAQRSLYNIDKLRSLHTLAARCSNIDGDSIEVGVYSGGTARVICKTLPNKVVHLFDRFAKGLPPVSEFEEGSRFQEGILACGIDIVKNFLRDCPNARYYEGWFPDTTIDMPDDVRFSFAHFDGDHYQTLVNFLDYVYPRMNKGGIILFDDYKYYELPGVEKGLTDFLMDKPETITELHTYLAYFAKV